MELLSYVVTFLVGTGAGFALKIVVDARVNNRASMNGARDSQGQVVQRDNVVKGSMAGRDVNLKDS